MSTDIAGAPPRTDRAARTSAAIVCESTACLPTEVVRRYEIGIVPIPFVLDNRTYLDGVDMTPSEFYERLLATHTVPMTSPPSPGEYLGAWERAAAATRQVISVTVDSKISTLQRSALLARDLAPELLPGVPVTVVDSLSAGMGQGFVALAAARAAAAGEPVERVVATANEMAQRVRMVVTLDTLDYLAKTSRIPQVAAILGGLLAIKPIIQISNGDIQPLSRVRTRRRSIEGLVEQMRRMTPPAARVHVAVQHARAADEAAHLEAQIQAEFDCAEIYTTEFTPVMGGYCGPGLLGLAFYAEADDGHQS
jgi:DegV family protein with EDD domain